jgi:DNA-binding Xre family transcriptional regulator
VLTLKHQGNRLQHVSVKQVAPAKMSISARRVLAENLIALRRDREWSQETLAFEAGLHRTFVAHVERQARNISLDNLERLAIALGVQSHELLQPRPGADQRTLKRSPAGRSPSK